MRGQTAAGVSARESGGRTGVAGTAVGAGADRAPADLTVLLPSPTGGHGVPATFEASTLRRQEVGGELYVAYVPGRPELGAVGDDQRPEVERRLAGKAGEFSIVRTIAVFWSVVTLALVAGWWLSDSTRRRRRTVGPDWQALRVRVLGSGEHVDTPPLGGSSAADERKQRENTRRLKGLLPQGDGSRVPGSRGMASLDRRGGTSGPGCRLSRAGDEPRSPRSELT